MPAIKPTPSPFQKPSSLVELKHPSKPTHGLIFIGDPHLWSFKPGRRRDASFRDTVLGKIAQAAEISNRLNLWPILLGDLFHAPDDNDVSTLVGLVRVLGLFDRKPVTLEGNHDKDELKLSERNPLTLLRETGQIDVMEVSGPWATLVLESTDGKEHHVQIGGTPYGSPLPLSYESIFSQPRPAHIGTVVWITHEDLAFEGSYPGALPLEAMPGIDLVVNGHMHATKLPVHRDDTVFYNPGNITRMSIDQAEHVPSVWEWTPFSNQTMPSSTGTKVPKLVQHVLKHVSAADIFDFEGRHSKNVSVPTQAPESGGSRFVEIMKQDRMTGRTDDGEFTRESLLAVLEELEATEEVRNISQRICDTAIRQHQEAAH